MTRLLVVLLSAVLLASCAKQEAGVGEPSGSSPGAKTTSANRYLAYEHTIGLEADEDKVASLFEAAQAACLQAVDEACTILDARLTRGDHAGASMRFRARSDGIKKLVAVLSAGGKVSTQSTSTEDLQGPIEDSAKKIAMLTAYRGQLEALRSRPNADLDSLMRLTRELAEVQGEIESLSGSQAHLTRRVETEILNVTIYSFASQSFWRPTADALSDFAGNLSEAIAMLVTVVAFLLPWGGVAVLCIWLIGMWRRRRRRLENA
jgi:Domain of unknown function (DUF4349)